jgi:Asp-tRNA(Asn)/Glu-tRNA(Gln) amidotransferase A subunit family amidase
LGLQLIGRPWEEADLLNHAYVLERAAGFVSKPKNGGKGAKNARRYACSAC